MPSPGEGGGERVCPFCASREPVTGDQRVWPPSRPCGSCGRAVPVLNGAPAFAPDLIDTASGFDLRAFDRLAEVEAGHYWFEPRNKLLVGLADRFFPMARRYLEVGCGTGFVLEAFAASRVWQDITGSELHPQGLAYARRRLGSRAAFVQMDARAIPAAGAFDLVGLYDVVEHIPEDEAVLESVAGCLSLGGGVIVSVPQHPALWSTADDDAHHVRRYRRGELERKLQRAGFDIVWSGSYVASLLPVMLASRLAKRRSEVDQLASREFDVSPTVNGALRAVLGAEVRLSLAGLRWPAGGSRVVVGRKRSWRTEA